uniref:Uncharacterized protein n=1 Tax=Wuchereria bancrofti TaxID=6293 RepID=A0AAF5RWG1_WUCBA
MKDQDLLIVLIGHQMIEEYDWMMLKISDAGKKRKKEKLWEKKKNVKEDDEFVILLDAEVEGVVLVVDGTEVYVLELANELLRDDGLD